MKTSLNIFTMLSHLFLLLLLLFSFLVDSVHFKIDQFNPNQNLLLFQGDAAPSNGAILFSDPEYSCQVGRAIYKDDVPIWDSKTGKLTDFTSHFSFTIDTQTAPNYGHGVAFFLAPSGSQLPTNSAGGFLGLFNKTYTTSPLNQIVHVEFDSFSDDWDPLFEHVGININSVSSSNFTEWNITLHSMDTIDVLISYHSNTKTLSVLWKYQRTSTPVENTTLSYRIDLTKVLPQWATVGFSAATGANLERNLLFSWEFNSTLDMRRPGENSRKKVDVIVGATVSVGALFIIMTTAFIWRWKQKKRKGELQNHEETNLTLLNNDLERGVGPRRFSPKLLAMATNNYSNDRKLGQGGFGAVYRGYIQDLDLTVAVKKISRNSKQGRKEYITEVKIISRLRHRNLVQLIGWCHDKGEFLLVYEFMSNGSLESHLFGKRTPLAWGVRYKIALGLASALLYLHEEWEQCVVHRDIKSSNVMLDSNFNVKLGDFGLARLMDHELVGGETTRLVGTLGYLAPEYISTGRASKESDVFSFGVVALEIVSGRMSRTSMEEESHKGLVEWIWDLYGNGQLLEGMDEKLECDCDKKQVECLMIVGLWSAYPDPNLRPSMKQAIQVLNFETTMPNLPSKMPVPTYHAPSTSKSSNEPSITVSLDLGR